MPCAFGRVHAQAGVSILARAEARALPFIPVDVVRAARVSILARAEARALHPDAGIVYVKEAVSILARAEARALPCASRD